VINDAPSAGGTYEYVIASADALGNENPSAPAPFSILVGAVVDLLVTVDYGAPPRLTWQSTDPSAVGFNVYRGGMKLNQSLITANSFLDGSFAGDTRTDYAVTALNVSGEESPARTVAVFPIALSAVSNPDAEGLSRPIVARYFNLLRAEAANNEASQPFALDRLELDLSLDGVAQFSQTIAAGQSVAAGDSYLGSAQFAAGPSVKDYLLKVSAIDEGETASVRYERSFVMPAVQPGVMAELSLADVPLAGGYADVNVCVENPGWTDMNVIVNRSGGSEPGDIYVAINNAEGLEISRAYYKGYPPGTHIAGGVGYVTIPPQGSLCVDIQVLVPAELPQGAQLTFVAGTDKFTSGGKDNQASISGTMISGITFSAYYGTAICDKAVYTNNEPVIITGQAINRLTGLPEPDAPVKIGFSTRGYKWFVEKVPGPLGLPVTLTTDENGFYSYTYNPPSGSGGEFNVWAAHPDVFDTLRQAKFMLYRLYATPGRGDIRMSKADTLKFRVSLINPGDTALTGFNSSFKAYTVDGGGNEIPETTLSGQVLFEPAFELKAGERKEVEIELTADMDAPDSSTVEFIFSSSQGAAAAFTGSVSLAEAIPVLILQSPSAGYVDISLDRGSSRAVTLKVKNNGLRELLDAKMTLPSLVGWIDSNLPKDVDGRVSLGNIPVGATKSFDLIFMPPADTGFGYHTDKLTITGSNSAQVFEVGLYPMITSDLTGSLKFTVTNILTQKVEGASINLRNPVIHKELGPYKTDALGQVTVAGLQEGEWSYQVTAPGHSIDTGTVTVIANQTELVTAHLNRSLVTINFKVEPVPYTDRYEIKIEQTFETHVPVPVMVIEPPSMSFIDVKPGFEAFVTVTVSNKGLISLLDLTIDGTQMGTARLDPLITYVPELKAMESIEVPIRISYAGASTGLPAGGASDFANCMTGNLFGGDGALGDDLVNLGAAFRGRSRCYYSDTEAAVMAGFAAGFYASLRIGNAASALVSPAAAAVTAFTCLAQALGYGGLDYPAVPLPQIAPTNYFTSGPQTGQCTNPDPLPDLPE
jgi:hypothetical protein